MRKKKLSEGEGEGKIKTEEDDILANGENLKKECQIKEIRERESV